MTLWNQRPTNQRNFQELFGALGLEALPETLAHNDIVLQVEEWWKIKTMEYWKTHIEKKMSNNVYYKMAENTVPVDWAYYRHLAKWHQWPQGLILQ